jgi:hypothetical protein
MTLCSTRTSGLTKARRDDGEYGAAGSEALDGPARLDEPGSQVSP